MSNMISPVILVILDGFGYSADRRYNAIAHAKTPHLERWFNTYPHAYLEASGQSVGLLPGMVGNSEVGHLTIGAGRIVSQPASYIHQSIIDKSFFNQAILRNALAKIKYASDRLHIMGILSDTGIHGTIELMQAAIQAAVDAGISRVIIHTFLDGRDCPPRSAAHYLEQLEYSISPYKQVALGSIQGRFYAMDRDHNWERIEQSYRALTHPQQLTFCDWRSALAHWYAREITDEFIPPVQLPSYIPIKNGDGIFFTNYRPDRARELTSCFIDRSAVPFVTSDIALSSFITPVTYESHLRTTVLFNRPFVPNTLKQVLAAHKKRIVSIAETEKYAHVTYFFNGQQEESVPGETRILVPSIRANNYGDHPCMSAVEITQKVLESCAQGPADFYLINYANADMVGHSGNFEATIKAIECLDAQLYQLYKHCVQSMGGTLIITADHGKAEKMFDDETKQPYTGHTRNAVPFIAISPTSLPKDIQLPTQLSQIAPFILRSMGIPVPEQMRNKL